jgi:lysozyme
MEELKNQIKKHEGYVNTVYKDSLGKRTVGYGHLCVEDHWEDDKKYDKKFLDHVFEKDFNNACGVAIKLIGNISLTQNAEEVIIEMCFQLGYRVTKFKKMWEALKKEDYYTASLEMIDSNWHKQTPKRCKTLARKMWQE